MSSLAHLIDKFFPQQFTEVEKSSSKIWSNISVKKASEAVWGMLTFMLFLALGPFSAIAVVLSVASLVPKGTVMEPESVN